jgi:hypothetical protein
MVSLAKTFALSARDGCEIFCGRAAAFTSFPLGLADKRAGAEAASAAAFLTSTAFPFLTPKKV